MLDFIYFRRFPILIAHADSFARCWSRLFLFKLMFLMVFILSACTEDVVFPTPDAGGASGVGGQSISAREYYDQQACGACHGNAGEGAALWPAPLRPENCTLVDCGNVTALATYIAATMPDTAPGACSGECAQKTAELIVGFSASAELQQPPSAARDEYDVKCAVCHGANGEGMPALSVAPIVTSSCTAVDCSDIVALSNYISLTMPPPGGGCVGECASQTAMVVNAFSVPTSVPIDNGMPNTPPGAEVANLTPPQRFCRDQAIKNNFPEEMALLCVNDEPSTLFLETLAAPYMGDGPLAQGPLLINQELNGVSEFATIGAMRINKPINEVFALRANLNNFNLTAGNASITSTQTAVIAAAGNGHQGGFELEVQTNVSVLIVNVNIDMKQQRQFYDLSGDGTVKADLTNLKPNDPLNVDNIASNVVGFWMADGATTLMVNLVHQEVDNQGFPGRALTTFSSLTQALGEHAFTVLSN